MLTLVTGGARSGKSRHAEALIAHAPQVLYIATSQIFDDEMAARIQHHRDGRVIVRMLTGLQQHRLKPPRQALYAPWELRRESKLAHQIKSGGRVLRR